MLSLMYIFLCLLVRICYDVALNELERPVITWVQILGS